MELFTLMLIPPYYGMWIELYVQSISWDQIERFPVRDLVQEGRETLFSAHPNPSMRAVPPVGYLFL